MSPASTSPASMIGTHGPVHCARLGRAFSIFAAAVVSVTVAPAAAQTANRLPPQATGLAVDERLGDTIRLDTPLTSAEGRAVMMRDYFGQAIGQSIGSDTQREGLLSDAKASGKPVIFALVYYECPIVCDLVLDRLGEGLDDLSYTVGEDFNLVVVSFDPGETPSLAAKRKEMDLAGYNRPKTPAVRAGWAYHVGEASQVGALAESVGFRYRAIANGEYSHPVVLMVLSPEGVVTRYLYGYDYPARDLKLALIEASEGTISESLADKIVAFCYMFDPSAGTYTLQAWRVMQLGGFATMALLGGFVGVMFLGDRARRRKSGLSMDAQAGASSAETQRLSTMHAQDAAPRVAHADSGAMTA